MIGLDTNILLRAMLDDDARQSPAARAVIGGLSPTEPGHINLIVLAELTWTLQRRYKATPEELFAAVETLLRSTAFVVDARDLVGAALEIAKAGRHGFNDALIGVLNRHAGCMQTLTFDHGAPPEAGFATLT